MKDKLFKILNEHWALVFFLTSFFCIIATKIFMYPEPFFDWDESIYVQVGKEMIANKSILPIWQGQIWHDKPPLIPLFYGIVNLIPFVPAEISVRLSTLILAIITLTFLYKLYYKVIKETALTTVAIAYTAFTPIVLQRAQVANIDVFLLLGWLGYILFYSNFWISFLFLALAVLGKSLLGFYPVGVMFLYFVFSFIIKKIDGKQLFHEIKKLTLHVGMLSSYYVIMLAIFGKAFWMQHIYETHFRRVAASIESHFGHRTFYIDIITEQYLGLALFRPLDATRFTVDKEVILFFVVIFLTSLFILYKCFKEKSISLKEVLHSFYLAPWFVFLNITKTKIAWYAYPAIPQFSLLLTYPITYIKKTKTLYYLIVIIVALYGFNHSIVKRNVLGVEYTRLEPHHQVALHAKDHCNSLTVLVEKPTRDSFANLEKFGLLITTSKWWGNHPSMVYYFNKKIDFVYSIEEFQKKENQPGTCISLSKKDRALVAKDNLKLLKDYNNLLLFKK